MPLKTLIMEMEFRRHTELSTTLGFIMSRKVGLYDMRIFFIQVIVKWSLVMARIAKECYRV